MNDTALFELDQLLELLPHRAPFLFVDRVIRLEPGKEIVAERLLRADEPQFAGHFPGRPIMPGVLVAEALAQTSGLLIGLGDKLSGTAEPGQRMMFHLAATQLKFTHPAVPGDRLRLKSTAEASLGGLYHFRVEARVGQRLIASGNLMLAQVHEAA